MRSRSPVGRRRQRVRVRLPPQPAAQEAPLQELAARDRQAIEAPAAQDDRDDVRALGRDGDDPHRWRSERQSGRPIRGGDDERERRRSTAPSTTPGATGWPTNDAPVSTWCENDRNSAR